MEGFPFMSIGDLWGNPTAVPVPIPSDDTALMLVVDAEGNPTVSMASISGTTLWNSKLCRAADAAGTGMVVGFSKKARNPGFLYFGNMGMDNWRCNDFFDSFTRGDGPLRSMPDYPWWSGTDGDFEIVSFQGKHIAGAASGGHWEENTFYPAYLSMTTYVFSPYNASKRWGFTVHGEVAAENTLIEARITVGTFDYKVYLTFYLWWGPYFSISTAWEVGADFLDMPTIINGQTFTGSSNGRGRLSATYLGHSYAHQF